MKRKEIERLLPAIYQQTLAPGNFLTAALEVMEGLHEPSERALGRLDAFFDPRRADDRFVPLLARWVDLDRLFDESFLRDPNFGDPISAGLGRVRELISRAAELARWRGTARGLRLFLETATGLGGYKIEEADATGQSFHLRVVAPAAAEPHRALLERIIEREKPAYVTYDLEILQMDAVPDLTR